MRTLGVAVVGSGFIGPVHVEGLRRAGQRVVGILGSSPDKSRQASETWGLETAYRDLEQILTDDSVDAVHIATPNHLHFEQTARVLRAGKHVLCEKPLAMNSQQSAELVELARQAGVAAGVAYNIRFYPLCHHAAELVQTERVGQVWHVVGSYVQDWLLKPTDFNWRVRASEAGLLRATADIGTHWLDLMQFILGQRVQAVCAQLRTVHPVRYAPSGGAQTFQDGAATARAVELQPVSVDTDDAACVMLRFSGGAFGCLWVSQVTAGRKNCLRFELSGSASSLAWNSERPNELWLGHRDAANELLTRDPSLLGAKARAVTNYPGGHNEGFPDTFKQLFRAFYGYIAAGDFAATPPFPTFADGHHEVRVCEAVLRSHQESRWVELEEID